MRLQVDNSPFSQTQVELLIQLLPTLTREQMHWLSGYLAGLRSGAAGENPPAPTAAAAPEPVRPSKRASEASEVTVLFGSQTGNATSLASELSDRLRQRGLPVALSCMSQYRPHGLKKTKYLLIVVSTYGEGDPPDKAIQFHKFLHSKRAPKLPGTRFSVLALGDLSYEQFCQTGKDIDRRLEELGGQRLYARTDCDVDFDEPASAWMEGVLGALCREATTTVDPVPVVRISGNGSLATAPAVPVSGNGSSATAAPSDRAGFGRTRPFPAEVLDILNLNGRGSDKETRHLELSIEGSGLAFEPGDSLGIYPQNPPRWLTS
jgi:sulfite reductase (NADPH) flavoprotein alpha-component